MYTVTLPRVCSHIDLLNILAENTVLHGDWDGIEIHFPSECFLHSSAIAFLCSWSMHCIKNNRHISFSGDMHTRQYLSRLDFFNHLDIHFEETFYRHPEEGRFIPLRLITDSASVFEASNAICDLVLYQFDNARSFLPAMEWAVYEIIDNIQLHAQTSIPGVVCGQYYPRRHRIDIGIYDLGRGIKASLSEAILLKDHEEAISKAMQKGVTRSRAEGMGNGLAGSLAISKLNKAEFHIWSGDKNYIITPDQTERFIEIPLFLGTGVLFRLNTQHPVALEDTFIADDSDNWTFMNVESERILNSGGIHIRSNCLHTGSREAALPLRRKIVSLIPDFEDVLILDFDDIERASSSFLDELLGKLVRELGTEIFSQKIRLVNIAPTISRMTNVIIHDRAIEMNNLPTNSLYTQDAFVPSEDEIILHLIASGIVELTRQVTDGKWLTAPYPTTLQRGLDKLAALTLSRKDAPPQGVTELLAWCQKPLSEWPLSLPDEAVGVRDVLLSNNHPTQLCEEWAYSAHDVEAEIEELSIMLNALSTCRNIESPESYQAFRRLLIEQPVLTSFEFQQQKIKPLLRPLSELLIAAYQPASEAFSKNGFFYCCPSCNNLLRPTNYEDLRCENQFCQNLGKTPKQIPTSEGVLWLKRGLRRFVATPGIFELRLEKTLVSLLGSNMVELWPMYDQYDLRLTFKDNTVWAVDVKDWANPFLLAKDVMSKPIPDLPSWNKAYYVFPNERRQQRPDYVRAFKAYFDSKHDQVEAVFERDFVKLVTQKLKDQN